MKASHRDHGDDAPATTAGFAMCWFTTYEEGRQPFQLLLPTSIVASIEEEVMLHATQQRERERALAAAERLREAEERKASSARDKETEEGASGVDEGTFVAEFDRLPSDYDPSRKHQVLTGSEVWGAASRARAMREGDYKKHDAELLARITKAGAFRDVANPARSPDRWIRDLAFLMEAHPHMQEVTRFVASRVVLSMHSHEPLVIPSILLNGPPGVGKTHYAKDLAHALGAPLRVQSMENAQASALWLGTERHWATASHGIVFEQIVLGGAANPVFLIDEIDKAPQESQYKPLAALHSLLEPVTACAVRDAGLDITFDASLAIYIATSNDAGKLPESLRTRFREFSILPPRGEQALRAAHVVATAAALKLSVPNFAPPEPALSRKLAHLSAREIYQVVQDSVARAVQGGRLHLSAADLPSEVVGDDAAGPVLH
ncbi:AAA family ATPase [Variovorax ginsengisoli]|uniref:AAA family ATPase n=1 Tax=Variovorax ginsengisoli TaxID=363844 RepID=A0ABT8S674_9BURK|nr:AAA family ATPase [Variovorax ginsengisoli]MDN8615251.1 AAA family ATPase [Variovorax ginsengisoli]MDO1534421.1 AAA family ATPase [Variovorax ginsengisoli]